jgi:hypothetical protein
MLFWDRLSARTSAYNVPIAFHITGAMDLSVLKRSLNLILARHEVLRSTYSFVRAEPVQRISPRSEIELRVFDFPPRADLQEVRAAVNAEASRPFVLSKDLMLRAALFHLAKNECILLLTLHHIASDGWSLGVLVSELLAAYAAYASGNSPALARLTLQYSDYALWTRARLRDAVLDRLVSFWRAELTGIPDPAPLIPPDFPKPARQSFGGGTIRALLPDSLVRLLAEIGQLCGCTTFMVMLSAFQALLCAPSGRQKLTLGIAVANRARPEFHNVIGCFMNALPIRTDLTSVTSFSQLLTLTRETLLRAFAHQELPFSEIVRLISPSHRHGALPFFNINFMFQSYSVPVFSGTGFSARRFDVDTGSSKMDLSVIVERKENFEVAFEYDRNLFARETMTGMLDAYRSVLQTVAQNPGIHIHDLMH